MCHEKPIFIKNCIKIHVFVWQIFQEFKYAIGLAEHCSLSAEKGRKLWEICFFCELFNKNNRKTTQNN